MADYSAQSQYAAAAHVPLIKSPAVRVPHPVGSRARSTSLSRRSSARSHAHSQVELPPDIHPLPDSVTPYFAYPFVLEPHVLTLESSRRKTLAAHVARREALLRSREDEKEQRRREALRRVAPGFDGHGTPLEPERASADIMKPKPEDVMENLVDELEKMEMVAGSAARTTTTTTR